MQIGPCLIVSHEAQRSHFKTFFPWHPYHRKTREESELIVPLICATECTLEVIVVDRYLL